MCPILPSLSFIHLDIRKVCECIGTGVLSARLITTHPLHPKSTLPPRTAAAPPPAALMHANGSAPTHIYIYFPFYPLVCCTCTVVQYSSYVRVHRPLTVVVPQPVHEDVVCPPVPLLNVFVLLPKTDFVTNCVRVFVCYCFVCCRVRKTIPKVSERRFSTTTATGLSEKCPI